TLFPYTTLFRSYFLLFPILDHPSSRTAQEQWAACSARGPSEVNCPSLVRDGHVFCYFACFFLLGSLVEETPCEHRENMQTPHRKALEIAHLSTVHSGEDLPPRANSAPCGNRTHDLLAVRRQCKQCKQLSHRATTCSLFNSIIYQY